MQNGQSMDMRGSNCTAVFLLASRAQRPSGQMSWFGDHKMAFHGSLFIVPWNFDLRQALSYIMTIYMDTRLLSKVVVEGGRGDIGRDKMKKTKK